MPVNDLAALGDFNSPIDLVVVADLTSVHDLVGADLVPGPQSCAVGGGCPSGPPCGAACCAAGEHCDPVTNTCGCGMNPACPMGEMCAAGGPAMLGKTCGVICCGGAGGPCPL